MALTILLQVLCVAGAISPATLPRPTHIFLDLWTVLASGEQIPSILLTLRDILCAAAAATGGGFVVGLVIHARNFLRRGLEPFLASYYAVPTIIFYPALIIVLGAGRAPIIAIAVALGIVAMISATLSGLDQIPPVLRKTARVLQLSAVCAARQVYLPAMLPYFFTGMKLAISYAVIGVIASEFIMSGSGIGYAIAYAYNNFDNVTMYGLILFVILFATLLNIAIEVLDRRLVARRTR